MSQHKIKIGITDCKKYAQYADWFREAPEGVEPVLLSCTLDNAKDLDQCAGLVLSGGEDIHPRRYNKPEYLPLLNKEYINEPRDEFEWSLIGRAFELGRPILGICRGLQKMNSYLGGTLIYDISTVLGDPGHTREADQDQRHGVRILEGSLLQRICGVTEGEINSAHHQAADLVAPPLRVSAWSGAQVVEALEWRQPAGRPWMLLLQWHPERMPDQDNPLAAPLRTAFLKTIIDSQ